VALSKTVFIDRGNRETARLAFDGAAKQMQTERQSTFIFVEGTRSYSTKAELLPFKKGAFHLAVQAQVPIVPVVVANYSNVLNLKGKIFQAGRIPVKGVYMFSWGDWLRWHVSEQRIVLTDVDDDLVLPPISTIGLTANDVDRLTKTTRDTMLEELVKLTELASAQRVALTSEERRRLLDDAEEGGDGAATTTGRDGHGVRDGL